jgi:uncharacterized protein (TIGR03503 family)
MINQIETASQILRKRFYSAACFFCVGLLFLPAAYGQPELEHKTKLADVRVVIDVSGSMKQNDPNNLRQPALELLVKLLPENGKAGVWTFGKYINMLVPHRDVNDEWRATALEKGQEINSTGLFTNIGEALEKAAYDASRPNEQYRTSIILLTDGMVDIDREPAVNQKEWRRIVDEVLPMLKTAGYTVHTVALSDNADPELMNKLALGTDGIAAVANSADELMKIFLAAFDNAAPAEQVPLKDNTFVVDSSVEEFTALIFTQNGSAPTRLLSPEGEEYTFAEEDPYLKWYRSDKYDLITVEKPIEGEWQVLAELDPDSRITVVSNLNLAVKPLKNNLFSQQSQTLSLLLSEGGATITRANFLELLDVGYSLERISDGQQWQASLSSAGPPANGVYTTLLDAFAEEGDYKLKVFIDGKSFTREFNHTFSVRQPFAVKSEKNIVNGKNQYRISVSYYGEELDRKKTKVASRVKDPAGRNAIKTFQLTESDHWELDFEPEEEGAYEFALRISAVNLTGDSFEVTPDLLVIDTDSDNPFKTPAKSQPVVATPEPPVKVPPRVEPPLEVEATNETPSETPSETPEPVVESPSVASVETVPVKDKKSGKWILYTGLGLGNVIILFLAYMAYRMIMGNKQDPELEELEQVVAELDSKSAQDKPTASKDAVPTMAAMDGGKVATQALSDDLNIASDDDNATPKPMGEMPAMHHADDDDSDKDKDLGVTDVEFSLDDFSSDDLDDDD